MATLVCDPDLEERLRAEREASGADQFDEVWEGTLMMAPLADIEHQELQTQLAAVLAVRIAWTGLGQVFTGVNVSDREVDWVENYRIPDNAVFLRGSTARNCGTHWLGGPDFAIEIASPGDRSRDKLAFYAKVAVRELLLIDRHPWSMELYTLRSGTLELAARSDPGRPEVITSALLPLGFRLVSGVPRPRIEVSDTERTQHWSI